jgi:hypothetical protein
MRLKISIILFIFSTIVFAQDIPLNIAYTRVYDFLDEMASDQMIEINSTVKPYSRQFIATKLLEIKSKENTLNIRQKKDLNFFLNEFSQETGTLPDGYVKFWKNDKSIATLFPPSVHYKDTLFRARILPLLALNASYNSYGLIIKRWIGAEFNAMIGNHLSIYGSLRDISNYGDTLSSYHFLNNEPGYEYKEASYGGDYSDSRGGIKLSNSWGSIGLVKDNPQWGDSYFCSNILSGRAPSFPMITLHLKPVDWFELNYFHGWLISNVYDSLNYYMDLNGNKFYRPANKFMAANMFTFRPIKNLNISFGNSIIYAEDNVQPVYFIPIAFYKSMDHLLTKGIGAENQNSQFFINISSRNIKHVHLYGSLFIDELSFSRLLPDSKEHNPISGKIGANISNLLVQNFSATCEYTATTMLTYKHIPVLTYASNSYNLGHYLGDNSREFFFSAMYKPVRGLDLKFTYIDAAHGNEYQFIRRVGNLDVGKQIISQDVMRDITWTSKTAGLLVRYEIFNNTFCNVNVSYTDIQGYDLTSTVTPGELRLTKEEYLKMFTPQSLYGKKVTLSAGINFGF